MYCKSFNGKYHIIVFLMVMIFAGCSITQTRDLKLASGFKDPGKQARPRAYWNWLNGDVTHDGLTRDLEEAKDKGLGGLEMWDTEAMRNPGWFVPAGPPFMGPESVASMHHAMKEAKRLGLDLGLITSSGWNAGGPWVPPVMASKNLFYSQVVVSGPGQIKQEISFPKVPRNCPKGEDGLPSSENHAINTGSSWPFTFPKATGTGPERLTVRATIPAARRTFGSRTFAQKSFDSLR